MGTTNIEQVIRDKVGGKLKERPEIAKNIGVAVAINLTGEGGGRFVIDMSCEPATIKADPTSHAATTISMEAEVFVQMAKGELDPQSAFLSGKVKVDGNLGIAIKLGQLLG